MTKLYLKIIIIILIVFTSAYVSAHGLSKDESKTILIEGMDNYLVKLIVSPKNIEFVRPNSVSVSVIDTEKAEHFSGKVDLSLKLQGSDTTNVNLARTNFENGLFKTRAFFHRPGEYRLDIHIVNDVTDMTFPFKFTVQDERIMSLGIIGVSVMVLAIFMTIIYMKSSRIMSKDCVERSTTVSKLNK